MADEEITQTAVEPVATDEPTPSTPDEALPAPAGARVGHGANTQTIHGKMDNASVRSSADALEGHFVTIDRSVSGVDEAYRDARLIRTDKDERGAYEHTGNYGVYMQPGAINSETGIPETAVVRLRDDTNALVCVPYESLSRATAGGR